MLSTQNIQFSYDGKKTLSFPDVECRQGEALLVLGQSGCGKTTLLHLLAGLLKPTAGSINVKSTNIQSLTSTALDHFRGKNIGVVFQKSHFMEALTVEENLLLAQQLAGEQQDKKKIRDLLDRLNLGEKKNAKTHLLSQGEQQRVAIARAVINQPALILADEPTSALDDKNANEVVELLAEQAENIGAILVVVTHDSRLKSRFENQVTLR